MFFRRFRLSAGHLKKVLPGFSTAQDSTSSLIAVGLLSLCGLMQDFTEQLHLDRYTLFMQIQAMIIQNAARTRGSLSSLGSSRWDGPSSSGRSLSSMAA